MRVNLVGLSILILLAASAACNPIDLLVGEIPTVEPLGMLPVLPEGFQGLEPAAAAPVGTAQNVGRLTIEVLNVIRPANHIADDGTFYTEPERGMEYLAVDISATCNAPADQSCNVSSLDFGAKGTMGEMYRGELMSTGISRGFESGTLPAGKSRSGYLLFEVARDDTELLMYYPMGAGFGLHQAAFILAE
jgi:hypothetical protein